MIFKSITTFVTSPSEKLGKTYGNHLASICMSPCVYFSGAQRPEDMPLTPLEVLLSARQGWLHCPICSSAANVTKEALQATTDVCHWPPCGPNLAAGQR